MKTSLLQAVRPSQITAGPGALFREKVEDFLQAQDITELSREVYRKGLYRFLFWAEEHVKGTLGKPDIIRYKAYLQEAHLSINTANSCLTALRCFFQYLEAERLTPDITKGVKGFRQSNRHLRDPLTAQQIEEMLSSIDRSTEEGSRNYAIVQLAARTGIRTIEIERADIEDIRQTGQEALLWIQRKGHAEKDEYVLLMPETLGPLYEYLQEYRESCRPSEPLFISCSDRNRGARISTATVRVLVKSLLKGIGINSPKLSAHSLRHFFATESLRAGAPLLQVKDALGHISIETTQKYLHNLDRIEQAAERFIQLQA